MKKISLKNRNVYKVEYIEDCKIIKKVLFDYGFELTLNEVEELWYEVSEEASACWLDVSDEEDVIYWLGLGEDDE